MQRIPGFRTKRNQISGGVAAAGGVFLGLLYWFELGLVLVTIGAFCFFYDWRNKRGRREVLFHSAVQVLVNASFILLILTTSLADFYSRSGQSPLVDFSALYAAGQLAGEDLSSLYNEEIQLRLQRSATGLEIQPEDALPFPYPPFVALLLVPLAWFSYESAFRLYMLLNLGCLSAVLYLLSVRLALNVDRIRLLVIVTTAAMPIYVNLLQGQTSFWGLLLLSLFVTDLLNRREGRSGFWIGLLSFKPQLVAIPLLVLAIRCHWRALVTALTVMVSLGFMSFLLIGWEGVLEYQALLDGMASGTHLVISFSSMQNLRALFRFLGWSDSIWLVSALVLVLFCWWRSHGLEARDTWTSAVFLILLVSPHLYLHDLSLMVLVLALYLSTSRSELLSRYLVFGLFVLALLPLLTLFGWAMTGMKLPVLPVTLLLLFLALVYARSQGRLLTG